MKENNMQILHTMLRVGDLDRSIKFIKMFRYAFIAYEWNPEYKYTLAFLGYEDGESAAEIELTYNWGVTEYDLGNAYGHIAIGVDDIYATCEAVRAHGGKVTREAGPVKGGTTVIAFVEDPDGYKIEFIENKSAKSALGN